ncbi:LysR family transcriptional regulator [Spirillospora sp. NPDC046719]
MPAIAAPSATASPAEPRGSGGRRTSSRTAAANPSRRTTTPAVPAIANMPFPHAWPSWIETTLPRISSGAGTAALSARAVPVVMRPVCDHRIMRERGTVTAAAEALHLTPSTVSQQLRQLARDLGVELLEAQGRRVRLTPAAHTVLRHADLLSAQWERARADLAEHRSGTSGQVRFCSVSSALAALVAPAAALLRAEHPGLTVHMAEKDSGDAAHLLLSHRADIAVVIPSEQVPGPDDARFTRTTLLDEPQDLLVPAGHPLASGGAARLADAAGEAWIGCPDRPDQHHLLLSACAAAGYVPRVEHEANEWFAVSSLVARGLDALRRVIDRRDTIGNSRQ